MIAFLAMTAACPGQDTASDKPEGDIEKVKDFLSSNCLECHSADNDDNRIDLEAFADSLDSLLTDKFNPAPFETIFTRLQTRQMPPAEASRPNEKEYLAVLQQMERLSQKRWKRNPQPGRVGTFRRLTRFEYQNAIRDLLDVTVDVQQLLPKDESAHGFDNVTVESLSPTLLTRYVVAAEKISRLAVGADDDFQISKTIRIPADRSQEDHVPGLPFGTRGGTLFDIQIPHTGEYEIQIKLARDRDEKVEGLDAKHHLDLLLDRKQLQRFELVPPRSGKGWQRDFTHSDSHLRKQFPIAAGKHRIGVTFPKTSASLSTIKRQPFDTHYNRHRHPRKNPAVFQVTLVGPIQKDASAGRQTDSRQKVFTDYPKSKKDENRVARKILSNLMRRAYRRPIEDEDLVSCMSLFERANKINGFESGIELGLASILVNPNFLFRIELDEVPSNEAESKHRSRKLNPFELASRLSFFLWSSLPDERLLQLAEKGVLGDKKVLEAEVTRMLADPRSKAFAENFAGQWLQLKNLDSMTPDLRLFPDFDDNLRKAFQRETTLMFAHILQHNRPVTELLQSDFTYLNERLATHYGIGGVKGSHFRKVNLPAETQRGGILRQGSVLTVTSYATRTSPTLRGNWILKNIIGSPPPPPPEDVPDLAEKSIEKATSVRERLRMHRENPSCNACHRLMDPIGFSLENYDAIGRWRVFDDVLPVDNVGGFPGGSVVRSVKDLENVILKHPENFIETLAEKLLTYAIGRGVTPSDQPIIRQIVSQSQQEGYRFRSIIKQIVKSPQFQMRSIDP